MKKEILSLFFLLVPTLTVVAQQHYTLTENISYTSADEKDSYKLERCKLDIYYPDALHNFTTVVWFHGGGLTGGNKEIPEALKRKGWAVVGVNYRLSPRAKHPAYIEDAAEAVAWVFKNIAKYGGDPAKIYVAGHSAGGYLTLMVGMDKALLAKYHIDTKQIKGLIPISGQTFTHYTIREERGQSKVLPYIDQYAPVMHATADAPPMLLVTGERGLEMTARFEENAHLAAILKAVGHTKHTLYEMPGFDHGTVLTPAFSLMSKWINNH